MRTTPRRWTVPGGTEVFRTTIVETSAEGVTSTNTSDYHYEFDTLSVHAKIVSQIRGDGVVPFGKYLSMFKAEG